MNLRAFSRPLLLAVLAAPLVHAADKGMEGVPLVWKPTSTLAESMGAVNLLPLAGAKIWIQPFSDSRDDKALIAENQEKDQPRPVTTRDDVAAFLGTHAVALYKEAGLSFASAPETATVTVRVEILRCMVTEKDTYKGELNLRIQVEAGGKPLWAGVVLGEATRWGRSYKLENYYEAISDSLVDAVGKSLKSDSFLAALAGKAAAAK
ncbi:MAG TPA: hypothetical protein VL181_05195 [Holophagaceae bacterium]|nr:hypothetical protein [Holophagaceae bacterium]